MFWFLLEHVTLTAWLDILTACCANHHLGFICHPHHPSPVTLPSMSLMWSPVLSTHPKVSLWLAFPRSSTSMFHSAYSMASCACSTCKETCCNGEKRAGTLLDGPSKSKFLDAFALAFTFSEMLGASVHLLNPFVWLPMQLTCISYTKIMEQ